MLGGVAYQRIDDSGLHAIVDGEPRHFAVDDVVICAGQEPCRELRDGLVAAALETHLVGGANEARELDARRAIEQGTRVAMAL